MNKSPERFLEVGHLDGDLRRRYVRGGAFTLGAQASRFTVTLGATAVLARVLTPEDFGLLAMVITLVGFVTLFKDLGLSMATVQGARVTHAQVSALFWVNVAFSATITAVIAVLAPALAWFYHEPRVTRIALVLAGTLVVSGLAVQHQALLKRQMRFGALAVVDVAAVCASFLCGIAAATAGWGYWALVSIHVCREIVLAAGVWTACRWRPGGFRKAAGVRGMLAFGGHLTGFNIVNYFARNFDKILLGRRWGATSLGLYNKAYQLLLLPVQQINTPLTGVAIPALSRLQDQPERYRAYYRRGVMTVVSIGMPAVVFLSVAAPEAVLTVLGDQWLAAGRIFRALSPAAFWGTFGVATGWVYVSLGRTDRQLRWGLIASGAMIAGFTIGLRWGAIGMAAAASIATSVTRVFGIMYCYRGSLVRMGDLWRAIRGPMAASAFAGGFLAVARIWMPWPAPATRLAVGFAVFGVAYVGAWASTAGGRRTAREMLALLRLGTSSA